MILKILVVVTLIGLATPTRLSSKDTTIQTADGIVQGIVSTDYWNNKFLSFKGIPYAEPPIGELRFKNPQPIKPWKGILTATELHKICYQLSPSLTYPEYLTEDCLYLSVHTTKINASRPVMVYIHGGGFLGGTAGVHGPEFLMSQDIVFVQVQYRLSIFGFLAIDDPSVGIPGNAGLKDQVMALKWVQRNIRAFGGDPNLVTIFGESAGGSSIQLLQVSPMAKGLFHRAIAQSGSASNPWFWGPSDGVDKYVEHLDCAVDKDLGKCLRGKTAEELTDRFMDLFTTIDRIGELTPLQMITIENENQPEEPFLTELPEKLIERGDFNIVPTLTGYNTHEGLGFIDMVTRHNITNYQVMIPRNINVTFGTKEAEELGNSIKKFYFGDKTELSEMIDEWTDYLTDEMFLAKIYQNAKATSKYTDVYFYQFDYYLKTLNNVSGQSPPGKVLHAVDLAYLFYFAGQTPKNIQKGTDEDIAITRMISLWTQFARNGDPNYGTTQWKPMTPSTSNYFKISEHMEAKEDPENERMKFWEELYEKYPL